MWKAALVGAFALTTGTISLVAAQPEQGDSYQLQSHSSGPVVTEAHIARLKAVLHLNADQHQHWAPVEAALRGLARSQRQDASAGYVERIGNRASDLAGTALHMRRLAAAAGPLIRTLDQNQKQNAMTLVRRLGFESLMASF